MSDSPRAAWAHHLRRNNFVAVYLADQCAAIDPQITADPLWLKCIAVSQRRALTGDGRGCLKAYRETLATWETYPSNRAHPHWRGRPLVAQPILRMASEACRIVNHCYYSDRVVIASPLGYKYLFDMAPSDAAHRLRCRWRVDPYPQRGASDPSPRPTTAIGARLTASYAWEQTLRPVARLAWVDSWPEEAWAVCMDRAAEIGGFDVALMRDLLTSPMVPA